MEGPDIVELVRRLPGWERATDRVADRNRDHQPQLPRRPRRPQLHVAAERIEQAFPAASLEATPCYNDLLPANVLLGSGRVWIIDYEYAGMNYAASDLANLAVNCDFDEAADDRLLVAYGDPSTRRAAGLFDESSFAKIEVTGPGAAALLERLSANRVDRPIGSVTYAAMLNQRGGIECDVTVGRLGAERFLVVTGTALGRHDRAWIEAHAPADGSVDVHDVTGALACLGLWGPRARDILAAVCDDDLGFPYMQVRSVRVGDVACWASRVTYVGELGWELYPSPELGLRLWDTLIDVGRPAGMVPCG